MYLVLFVSLVHCTIHLISDECLLCAKHSEGCIVRHVHSATEVKRWSETGGAKDNIPEEACMLRVLKRLCSGNRGWKGFLDKMVGIKIM